MYHVKPEVDAATRYNAQVGFLEDAALMVRRYRAVGNIVEFTCAAREETSQTVDEAARRTPGFHAVVEGASLARQG